MSESAAPEPSTASGAGAEVSVSAAGGTGGSGVSTADVLRGMTVGALLGAAAIHFAYAPAHFDQQTSHGTFFVVAGWVQLLLAVALAVWRRPARSLLAFTALANAGLIGVWILSRTAGVPGNDAESVGFPDLLATGLEAVAVLAASALLLGWSPSRRVATRPAFGLAGTGALAVAVLVSLSVAPSVAGEHEHADDDHGVDGHAARGHGHDGEEAAAGHAEGTDHAAMSGAGSAEEWAATREAALTGYLPEDELARISEINRQYLRQQILDRSRTLGDLTEEERNQRVDAFVDWVMANVLEGENGEHGAGGGGHSHGPTPWVPLTDPAEQLLLQQQLETAGEVIPQFPTAAEAMAGGYFPVTPWVPGIGAHYISPGLIDGTFDPAKPEMLLYNGNSPTSELVGLSYATIGAEPPEGFAGENDSWHNHPSLCMVRTLVVGPDHTPDELCASIGGRKGDGEDGGFSLWMAHLWQVPGWESSWGLFSGESPAINMATTDVGHQPAG